MMTEQQKEDLKYARYQFENAKKFSLPGDESCVASMIGEMVTALKVFIDTDYCSQETIDIYKTLKTDINFKSVLVNLERIITDLEVINLAEQEELREVTD